jgi:hypothetical protein
MPEELTENVKRLIAESIDSIPELEAILLLREHPDQGWTPDEAGKRLYLSRAVASYVLTALADRGFLLRNGDTYRYGPPDEGIRKDVDDLAAAYSRHLVAVTRLIHAKPSASVRSFADAFRFRKD